jgi:ketosteroid isomerase-like protein
VATASPAAAVEAFHAALTRGDASTAADLLAEDVVIFEEGEAEASKSAYMASHLPADIAFLSQVKEEVTSQSQQQSGNLAWVISRGTLQGSYDGKPVRRQTTETMVLRRADGGWRIVHAHWSSSPLNK